MNTIVPYIAGYGEIPPDKIKVTRTGDGRKGRTWKYNPARGAIVRQALSALQPGKAVVIECPNRAELQTFRCCLHTASAQPIRTKARGLALYVYPRDGRQLELGL